MRWIVSCDQPFDEVDKPEFRELLEYCNRYGEMQIPSRTTIATRVKEMGQETVAATKKMIEVEFETSLARATYSLSSLAGSRWQSLAVS